MKSKSLLKLNEIHLNLLRYIYRHFVDRTRPTKFGMNVSLKILSVEDRIRVLETKAGIYGEREGASYFSVYTRKLANELEVQDE